MYKLTLKSEKSHLSPVVDLRSASAKTVTNRVENAVGTEGRYGKRYQEVQLFPYTDSLYKETKVAAILFLS